MKASKVQVAAVISKFNTLEPAPSVLELKEIKKVAEEKLADLVKNDCFIPAADLKTKLVQKIKV